MDPVTIGIGAGLLLASIGWRWLKRRRPKLAARLDGYERELKSYAGDAFRAVELLGAATGWSGAEKLTEYKRRVERFTNRHGIPRGFSELDDRLEDWALDWSLEATVDPEVKAAAAAVAEKYVARPMQLGRWKNP